MKTLNEQRNELVVKSNDLIRNTRASLTAQEQKILIYLVSLIEPDDKELKTLKIKISDYCEVAGIQHSNINYQRIKESIKSIRDKSWWIEDKGDEVLFSWLDTARIEKRKGIVDLRLSDSLRDYLLELKESFTKYNLLNVLVLRGKYSIKLYELLKSYLWQGKYIVSVENLREIIDCNSFKKFAEFNRNVLKKSIVEINDYTDLFITYETIKTGRYITDIEFTIESNDGIQLSFDERIAQAERINERLNGHNGK